MKRINKIRKKINYDKVINRRFIAFLVVILLFFGIVLFKLTSVMIVEKKEHINKLDRLTNKVIEGTSSPRGRIYDRNYNIIVDNKSLKTITYKKDRDTTNKEMIDLAYKISKILTLDYNKLTDRNKREFYYYKYNDKCNKLVTKDEREMVKQRKMTSHELEELKIKRISEEELNKFNEEDIKAAYLFYLMNKGYSYEEKTIKSDATDYEYAYISEHNVELEGFNTKLDWERVYPYGDTFRSILGTVSTSSQGIPAEDKDYYLSLGYSLNDRVGLSYIEKEYENYLHGKKAVYEAVSTDEVKLISEGSRGQDIVLSIDINLQKDVEDILSREVRNTKGEANTNYYDHSSVVIQDPKSGEILAMASKKIVNGEIRDNTISLLTEPIMPGSVVKGASMLVGYNTGAIKIGEVMLDECVKISGMKEKCSSVLTLGRINDITALAKSSNVYQFKTAIRVNGQEYRKEMKLNFNQSSFDTYRKMYHSFGLGVSTGIDLPVESIGYSSKDKAAGNLLDFVMGQYETYTPLQLSQYISTIANSGERKSMHLLKEVRDSSDTEEIGKLVQKVEPKVLNKVESEGRYISRVQQGFQAVMEPGGYGYGYISLNYRPSGKTGTSQSFIDTNGDGRIDTETITSSYIGYFPRENPKVSIVVTSPDSSHPNSNINYASQVTYRITGQVANAYVNRYGV